MGMLKRWLAPRGDRDSRSMENPSVGWEGLADMNSNSSDSGERVNVRRALSIRHSGRASVASAATWPNCRWAATADWRTAAARWIVRTMHSVA